MEAYLICGFQKEKIICLFISKAYKNYKSLYSFFQIINKFSRKRRIFDKGKAIQRHGNLFILDLY